MYRKSIYEHIDNTCASVERDEHRSCFALDLRIAALGTEDAPVLVQVAAVRKHLLIG